MSKLPTPPFKKIPLTSLFDVSRIITILLYDFAPGFHTVGEAHDFWEIVYIHRGELSLHAGDRLCHLSRGEMVFHRPGEFHNIECDGVHSASVFIMTFDCHSPAMEYFAGRILRIPGELTKLVKLLIDESTSSFTVSQYPLKLRGDAPIGGQQLVKMYLEELLIRLMRFYEAQGTGVDGGEVGELSGGTLANEIRIYLASHIYTKVTIEELCDRFHFGKSHICEVFRRATGDSILQYYLKLKLTEAKRMLHEESTTISEISERLGFESASYFSRIFRRHVGMTPGEFRKTVINTATVYLEGDG